MTIWLKQSTAATVKMGPFVDSTDGNSVEDGLTIQKADVRLSKNGGNMAAANADQGVGDAGAAYDEIGYYDISLDTTDTGTLGNLKVMVHESGALPVWAEFMVVTANVWNTLCSTDNLEVDLATVGGGTVAAFIDDIWADLVTLGATAHKRGDLLAYIACREFGESVAGAGTQAYYSPDGVTAYVAGDVDENGQRSNIVLTAIA